MKKVFFIIISIMVLVPVLVNIGPWIIPIFLFAGVIVLKIKYPEIKGAIGEAYVNRMLDSLDSNYKVYRDLYVPNEKGETTQIDHVVTSPFGIFVIETKHYNGWIFGKENQPYWTQVIYKRKEKFYNPIWQNNGHVKALKSYLKKTDFSSIFSIIAFSQNSTLKFEDNFKFARVIQLRELKGVIKEWDVQRIRSSELQGINRMLEGLQIKDKKEKRQIKKQHLQGVKNSLKEKTAKEKEERKQPVCPKCGGALSIKNGKYGSFYGCDNFPKCRYTKQGIR